MNIGGYKKLSVLAASSGTSSGTDDGVGILSGNVNVVVVTYSGSTPSSPSSYQVWVNGTERTAVASGAFGSALTNTIFGRPNAAYFNGLMFEVLAYDSVLSHADVDRINQYINSKWAAY